MNPTNVNTSIVPDRMDEEVPPKKTIEEAKQELLTKIKSIHKEDFYNLFVDSNQRLKKYKWKSVENGLSYLNVQGSTSISGRDYIRFQLDSPGRVVLALKKIIPGYDSIFSEVEVGDVQLVNEFIFEDVKIKRAIFNFLEQGRSCIKELGEKAKNLQALEAEKEQLKKLQEAEKELQRIVSKTLVRRQQREIKQKKYENFHLLSLANQNALSSDAYAQVVKAILIGGMASGSKPFDQKNEEMPTHELQQAVDSLKKKHNPEFPHLKSNYQKIWKKQPLRARYGGVDNVGYGVLYSKLRIIKYLSRESMTVALFHKIKAELSVTEYSNIDFLLKKAEVNFCFQVKNLASSQHILAKCVTGLAAAFIKAPPHNDWTQLDEVSQVMQLITMMEMTKSIRELKDNRLELADYYKIMAMLNVAIMNKLAVKVIPSDEESFFKKMTQESSGATLVDNSGKGALLRSLQAIGIILDEGKIPGFDLPRAMDDKTTKGYFAWVTKNEVKNTDQCALIGRDTETLYDFDFNNKVFQETLFSINKWVASEGLTKTLVVDVTIPMATQSPDFILQTVLALRGMLNGKFDVLVVQSEQKQHSLGLGKFAAGSSFLITNNKDRRQKFDQEASRRRTMDQELATFYRENMSNLVTELVKYQSEIAKSLAKEYGSEREKVIPNGPFVLIENESLNTHFLAKDEGYSFGFVVQNWTSWRRGQKRVDPGVLNDDESVSKCKM